MLSRMIPHSDAVFVSVNRMRIGCLFNFIYEGLSQIAVYFYFRVELCDFRLRLHGSDLMQVSSILKLVNIQGRSHCTIYPYSYNIVHVADCLVNVLDFSFPDFTRLRTVLRCPAGIDLFMNKNTASET